MSAHAYIAAADVPPRAIGPMPEGGAGEEMLVSFGGTRFRARPVADGQLEFVVPRDPLARGELFSLFLYFGIPFLVLP
ncbi:hypothetical protein [Burkholderia gladioli]|uniref:hypothetical protein n=1 Tax=Burkholderia gladioli TaxID=28095 RepID=UPI001641BD72|nr:hypothetical protein [Burkholderia gladioli]